jgi:hypothetical protein
VGTGWLAVSLGGFFLLWALESVCNAGCDLLCILLRSLVHFLGIYSWVPAYHDSPKLVEMVRFIHPISRFGGYLVLNDAKVDGRILYLRTVNSNHHRVTIEIMRFDIILNYNRDRKICNG